MLEHTGCIITFISLTTELELIVQGSPCSKGLKFKWKQWNYQLHFQMQSEKFFWEAKKKPKLFKIYWLTRSPS